VPAASGAVQSLDQIMIKTRPFALLLFAVTLLLAFTAGHFTPTHAETDAVLGVAARKWEVDLTAYSRVCSGGHYDCHFSSPVLADMNGDGFLDVVAATSKGFVVVTRHNGTILWTRDLAPPFGMAAGTHEIASSPAVADIDADGLPEIVVGVGTTRDSCTTLHHGGVIVLEHNGAVKTGWPRLARDENGDGCRDSVYGTPVLANLDSDAQLEIVYGGFDKQVNALNPDGSPVAGFPPDSHHALRFPTWPNLIGHMADTIWSSVAASDTDLDGKAEIFLGTDEGNFDDRYGGDSGGWNCPYTPPPGWPPGYCGGSLYGFESDGTLIAGFPRYYLEAVRSSPAIADVNDDGSPELFVGAGSFYYDHSPDHPTIGFRVYGMSSAGQTLPGWPVSTGGAMPASPAIGDIAGDGKPEIIIPSYDSRIYAFYANGQPVAGFPMTPRREQGQTGFQFSESVVLGDYDGDGKMEIFINNGWTITVVDGNGQQLTGDNFPNNTKPIYYAFGSLLNSPAVGDIDNDGRLELIAQNSHLYVWDLVAASDEADWPFFKRDARRNSAIPLPPRLMLPAEALTILHPIDQNSDPQASIRLTNTSEQAFDWTAESVGTNLSVAPQAGTLQPGEAGYVIVTIDTHRLTEGLHELGEIAFEASIEGQPILGSPDAMAINLLLGDIEQSFIPMLAIP
jgi:hypothetical protein